MAFFQCLHLFWLHPGDMMVVVSDSSFLLCCSGLWSSSALRWWWGLSVAVPYWEELTSLHQESCPAPRVRDTERCQKRSTPYVSQSLRVFFLSDRYESWRCGFCFLRPGGEVHARSHQLPGKDGVCGKWSGWSGPFQHLQQRTNSQVRRCCLHLLCHTLLIMTTLNIYPHLLSSSVSCLKKYNCNWPMNGFKIHQRITRKIEPKGKY